MIENFRQNLLQFVRTNGRFPTIIRMNKITSINLQLGIATMDIDLRPNFGNFDLNRAIVLNEDMEDDEIVFE